MTLTSGSTPSTNGHVEVAEVLHLMLDRAAGVALALAILLAQLLAWRFSRTFASRFNFANVVFFLPAKVDLQVVQRTRTH